MAGAGAVLRLTGNGYSTNSCADCTHWITDYRFMSDCTDLGILYEKGEGFDRNPKQAAALYRKACNINRSFQEVIADLP